MDHASVQLEHDSVGHWIAGHWIVGKVKVQDHHSVNTGAIMVPRLNLSMSEKHQIFWSQDLGKNSFGGKNINES